MGQQVGGHEWGHKNACMGSSYYVTFSCCHAMKAHIARARASMMDDDDSESGSSDTSFDPSYFRRLRDDARESLGANRSREAALHDAAAAALDRDVRALQAQGDALQHVGDACDSLAAEQRGASPRGGGGGDAAAADDDDERDSESDDGDEPAAPSSDARQALERKRESLVRQVAHTAAIRPLVAACAAADDARRGLDAAAQRAEVDEDESGAAWDAAFVR